MPFRPFRKNDIFYNTIVTHPEYRFYIYNNKVSLNSEVDATGKHTSKVTHTNQGYISLYEMNVDRPDSNIIKPFITKSGARTSFSTITTSDSGK